MSDFLLTIRELVARAHGTAKVKGWWDAQRGADGTLDPDKTAATIPEKLCLIHSEVSEALECYRDPEHAPAEAYFGDGGKPEGLPAELADVVIRCADLAGALGIDLDKAIRDKLAWNTARPQRHGGKRA
jgi:NTP pyrophosphatase (non-canonical NTP hydrolase)